MLYLAVFNFKVTGQSFSIWFYGSLYFLTSNQIELSYLFCFLPVKNDAEIARLLLLLS